MPNNLKKLPKQPLRPTRKDTYSEPHVELMEAIKRLPTDPDWFDKVYPLILIYGNSLLSQLSVLAAAKSGIIGLGLKALSVGINYVAKRVKIDQKDLKIKI